MTNFTKNKERKGSKNFEKPLKLPQVFLWFQQLYYFLCIDLHNPLGDAVLMTSLHDVMSTRVDNSGLPEGRL